MSQMPRLASRKITPATVMKRPPKTCQAPPRQRFLTAVSIVIPPQATLDMPGCAGYGISVNGGQAPVKAAGGTNVHCGGNLIGVITPVGKTDAEGQNKSAGSG